MIPPLLALFSWPLVAIVLFRKMRLPVAIIATILGGYLLLPPRTGLDLPLLPSINKNTLPVLMTLLLAAVLAGRSRDGAGLAGYLPRNRIAQGLLLLLIATPFLTVLTNTDPVVYLTKRLPALTPFDGFSMALSAIMGILPLLVARKYLATPEAQRILLTAICVAACGYSFLVLFEVRMSPQLNSWIYGFFPHSWRQHIRGDGFRPVVFLGHGLVLGIFLACAVLATAGLSRLDAARRGQFLLATFWLLLTLLLSKNLGAVLITFVLLPVVFLFGVRLQLLIAAAVAGLFLLYPVVRSADVLPLDRVLAFAANIDPQRASSFQTRLENEDQLLAKAAERPLFGWGPWGRSRVQNEQGEGISTTDGAWIIALGLNGWAGYISQYGLLALPVLLLFLGRRRHDVGMESSVLALVLCANLVDLIPNSALTPLTWLIAGSLWGRLELGVLATQASPQETLSLRSGHHRGIPLPDPAREDEGAVLAATSAPQSPYTRQKQRIDRRRIPRT